MHFCLALLAVQPFSATLKATAKTSKQASETAIKIAVDCEIRLGIYLSTRLNIVESAFRCCIQLQGTKISTVQKVFKRISRFRQVGSTQLAKTFRFYRKAKNHSLRSLCFSFAVLFDFLLFILYTQYF